MFILKLSVQTKIGPDLCIFCRKVIIWNFYLRKYCLLFFPDLELLMIHKKIGKKQNFENLPPKYLSY